MEENKNTFERTKIDFTASLAKMIVRDLISQKTDNKFFGRFTKENAVAYLENPRKYEKELRNMSKALYNLSPQYRRLINYFAKMSVLQYSVKPYKLNYTSKPNKKKYLNDYANTLNTLENMNIKHEFIKILTTCFREDVFFGYEYESEDSYFIKPLDADLCQIVTVEDGSFNLAFDFSYFNSNKDKLKLYPQEFTTKYNSYLRDKTNLKYQEIDSTKTICIKVNEDLDYCIPPFANVFSALYDIEDYKALKKAKTEIDNYKLLGLEIPLRKDSEHNDDFVLELDTVLQFYDKISDGLPEGVGVVLSPVPIKELNFSKQISDTDKVSESEKMYWNSTGVSGLLFSGDASSGATLTLSVKTDEMIVFSLLKQCERWINRKLKRLPYKNLFKIKFLELTIFNQDKVIDQLLKAAQYGVPVKEQLCVALGMSPSEMLGMTFLENDILELTDKWIPLSSSHTQSGSDNEGGRKKKDVTELSESGEQTDEDDANNKDNRV